MSIKQTNVVDFIGIDNTTGDVVLTISDHLMWPESDNEHFLLLQEKLNTYLSFIESGELLETYPNAEGRAVLIEVVCKYPLGEKAKLFFENAAAVIQAADYTLKFSLLQKQ